MKEMKGRTVRYFKSKQIAGEIGTSNKEVGAMLAILAGNSLGVLKVEGWAYSTATTWKVTWR